jgi:hypothetical protein
MCLSSIPYNTTCNIISMLGNRCIEQGWTSSSHAQLENVFDDSDLNSNFFVFWIETWTAKIFIPDLNDFRESFWNEIDHEQITWMCNDKQFSEEQSWQCCLKTCFSELLKVYGSKRDHEWRKNRWNIIINFWTSQTRHWLELFLQRLTIGLANLKLVHFWHRRIVTKMRGKCMVFFCSFCCKNWTIQNRQMNHIWNFHV